MRNHGFDDIPTSYLKASAWTESAVQRGKQTAKLNELTCLLSCPSPVEAVEKQSVSAHSVSVSNQSCSSRHAHVA
jgi:hypothetical protein